MGLMYRHAILWVWVGLAGAALGMERPVVWPEHPRPDFQRTPWINLNGPWDFAFDPDDRGESERWYLPGRGAFDRRIVVPFPWESPASGIARPDYQGVAWYRRTLTLPAGADWQDKEIWLVVGACDWQAEIWVNGQPAGCHVGGYTPFEVNLSRFAAPGEQAVLVIRAEDRTDPHQPTGKQVRWYTRTSGIWQTVYLEPRGRRYIARFRAFPDIRAGSVTFDVTLAGEAGDGRLTVRSPNGAFEPATADVSGAVFGVQAGVRVKVRVTEPKLWSPETPVLYPFVMELADVGGRVVDRVASYFGLREISVGKAPGGDPYIFLNGKPIYLRGALHQSFHPDGIYQYPDDAAVRRDYEICKRAGLNFLRIHIKAPIPRELYWADTMGVLIMQDMPNFWKDGPQARRWWRETFQAVLERDFNHPAVFSWCLFNETWGFRDEGYSPDQQRWVASMYELAKRLDPTRLVEDNSPCSRDHVVTDINSWHFYIHDYAKARRHIQEVVEKTYPGSGFNYARGFKQDGDPLINSEYGGISARMGDQDISWCLKFLTNELRRHARIGGYVYTELCDIEWEHNGLVNYDRSPKQFGYDAWHPGFTLADIHNPDFLAVDAPPVIELVPGQTCSVPVALAHFSGREVSAPALRWRVDWVDEYAQTHRGRWERREASWRAYDVCPQTPLVLTVPRHPPGPLGTLLIEWMDGDRVLARNYVHLLVQQEPIPRCRVKDPETIELRFNPCDFAEWGFAGTPPAGQGIDAHKIAARGTGYVEYHIRVPAGVAWDRLETLRVAAELASRAGDEKLDWPATTRPTDHPQTDGRKWPTEVRLLLNGRLAGTQVLPDDPADARGVLSHLAGRQGAYGYWTAFDAPPSLQHALREELKTTGVLRLCWEIPPDAKHKGGLTIFGEKLGRYPAAPTIVLTFHDGHGLRADRISNEPVAVDRWLDR